MCKIVIASLLCLLSSFLFCNENTKDFMADNPSNIDYKNNWHNASHRSVIGDYSPVNLVNRIRNFRVNKVIYKSDYNYDGILELGSKDLLYYNPYNPSQLTSILSYQYDAIEETYSYNGSRVYFYALNGENIIRYEDHFWLNNTEHYTKNEYEYDNHNRLSSESYHFWDYWSNCYRRISKTFYVYDDNRVLEKYQGFDIYAIGTPRYLKQLYEHDFDGRIVSCLESRSNDSLNWENNKFETFSYHPNDTSTGDLYTEYLSHSYIINDYFAGTSSYSFGMINEYVSQQWNGEGWWYSQKRIISYNQSNEIETCLTYGYNIGWNRVWLESCNYDLSNNLILRSLQHWNTTDNTWGDIVSQNDFSWEQDSANEENVFSEPVMDVSVCPNPFRNDVLINLISKDKSPFNVKVYNSKGQMIRQYVNLTTKSITWDGKDNQNKAVSSGVYVMKVTQNRLTSIRKIIRIN